MKTQSDQTMRPGMVGEVLLAWRLLWRDQRAGELALIATAIVIAVASVTTVGFFTDRVHAALDRQANQLLGADLVILSPNPIGAELESEARRRGLATTRVVRFPSMAIRGDQNVLASVKAVRAGYPLRGELRLASELYGADRRTDRIPDRGTAWVDERLIAQLGLAIGGRFELGRLTFRVPAVLTHEPDASIGFLNAGPRVIINEADLAETGLIQPGSRVGYRLQIAGAAPQVDAYRIWALAKLQPGQRIEGIRDARPEIRSAVDRAEKFLSLAALVTVVLAAAAIGLAVRRFLRRHLDACAMMRCLGASQMRVLRLYLIHFAILGLVASGIGCAFGIAAQALLAQWLGSVVAVQLPAPGGLPALHGVATGIALLLGFALPPLTALRRVPTLRVLRRELGVPSGGALATYAAGYAVIAVMIFWKARDVSLGAWVIGGFTVTMAVAGAVTWLLVNAAGTLRTRGVTWRYGVANLRRRLLGSMLQVIALGVGMMALLVLTIVRQDLLHTWQRSLPVDAPNRFVINIQPEQVAPLNAFFAKHGVRTPSIFPMVRGRLTRINERPVSSANYGDERARRLVDREFNLSWASEMQADNRLVSGEWWSGGRPDAQFSVEQGIAETLGMRLGDVLTFDVAGAPVSARITSLRKVDWDTFNVNFFVVAPPGMLESYPATYVTSFYLAPGNAALLASLVREFPNFLLIDVAHLMSQVHDIMDQVARAVEFVFLFTLVAGLTVLYAAIASTQDERLYEATVMRTLGASRAQLRHAILAEFGVLGMLAGCLAAAGATALGYVVATRILHLPYVFSSGVWIAGALAGALGIAAAGYLGTRSVLNAAPLEIMRELA